MHETLQERRALLQEARILMEERRALMDHRDMTQPRPDAAVARDRARDQHELDVVGGGHYHAASHVPHRVSVHGEWDHEFTTSEGLRWRWRHHPENPGKWVEVLILDHGHVTPIALTEDDLASICVVAKIGIRRLRRAGYQD